MSKKGTPLYEVRRRALPVQTQNKLRWEGREFRPTGPLLSNSNDEAELDMRRNPKLRERLQQAARMLVGFNVDDVPTWNMEDLVGSLLRHRRTGATFLATRGVWIDTDTGKRAPPEDGGQVIIIDFDHLTAERFEADMVTLAEKIAQDLRQKSILVEMQTGGSPVKVIEVGP